MLTAAFLRAKAKSTNLPGDVILNVVVDEESGSDHGAKFLVEKHPEQYEGVRYALGEFGGFSLHVAGREFYPIMVVECGSRRDARGLTSGDPG